MKNSTRNSENSDLKIEECLTALEEHKKELDFLVENAVISMDEYLEILEEAAQLTCKLIMHMRIADDYRKE